MKPSSYNIIVQVDNEMDRYVLINSYTYAFDIVNQDVYQSIKMEDVNSDISDATKGSPLMK